MKKYLIILCLLGVCKIGIAQTNIFPDTGKVGIGTINPIVKLQVRTAPNSNIGLFDYSGSPTLVGFTDEGASSTLRLAGYPLIFSGNGGMGDEHLRIHTNGNVGIGTTNPQYSLDIAGTVNAGIPAGGGIFRLEGKGGFSYPWHIRTTTLQGLHFASNNGIGNVVFLDNGNVGIGTITPIYNLDVAGDTRIGTEADGGNYRVEGKGGFSYAWNVKTTTLQGLDFAAANGIGRVVFLDNGNVGIGTTDPKGYKLAVAGDMIAESVKVKLQGTWPDFVFEKDYKLEKLEDLERFIQVNKHLPEIPSAAEVEKDGMNLGKMNAKLLQKIEELTLHLIEMDKKVTAIKDENTNLKLEINQLKSKPY